MKLVQTPVLQPLIHEAWRSITSLQGTPESPLVKWVSVRLIPPFQACCELEMLSVSHSASSRSVTKLCIWRLGPRPNQANLRGVSVCSDLNWFNPNRLMYSTAQPTGSGTIRRCVLVRIGVAQLEEMRQCGVGFEGS